MAEVEGTGTVSVNPKKWWVVGLLGLLSIIAGVLALDAFALVVAGVLSMANVSLAVELESRSGTRPRGGEPLRTQAE